MHFVPYVLVGMLYVELCAWLDVGLRRALPLPQRVGRLHSTVTQTRRERTLANCTKRKKKKVNQKRRVRGRAQKKGFCCTTGGLLCNERDTHRFTEDKMPCSSKILIALGNEIRKEVRDSFTKCKKGDVGRMYVNYLSRKYNFDEWLHLSNINAYVCEKDMTVLIKPITSIGQSNGMIIKNILTYFNCRDTKNVCIIIPDMYRSIGKYKYKNYIKIHKKLGPDFYNILNTDIISSFSNNNFLQLCFGINNLKNEKGTSIHTYFQENINEQEYHIFLKTFQLADEYFKKQILNSSLISTNYIHFKQKYPAMEPQKCFKKTTSKRRFILDVYKHMYK
ncbi:conserved Plasmodium protein, unknown function [Plasmodium ovale wallikeri]|uniref:Uncharacterized protein n=2 Tax=Plasmodium ovale TaxID=36330 RepID=A0A1A8Z4R1_PLAOA|nr:conserved Plasmodium protein, unknown function [Plasmodium ovale wallikeri]SBT39346.1 conserved Plasmodium protein, unknown function [Plasmodium ovale wallikeri]